MAQAQAVITSLEHYGRLTELPNKPALNWEKIIIRVKHRGGGAGGKRAMLGWLNPGCILTS